MVAYLILTVRPVDHRIQLPVVSSFILLIDGCRVSSRDVRLAYFYLDLCVIYHLPARCDSPSLS